MKIPKTFQLGRGTYKVSLVPSIARSKAVGQVDYLKREIQIAEVCEETQAVTFWHEATHAILREMRHPLFNSEKFVTEFSKHLDDVVSTARF